MATLSANRPSARPDRARARSTVPGAVLAAAAVAVGGASFVASFTPGRTAVLVAAGVLAGLAGGWALGSRRLPVLVGIGLALGAGLVALAAGASTARPATVIDGVVDGPRRLVTGPLPADADVLARVPPILACWVVATLAVALARRGRGAGPVLLAGLLFLGGTATGLGGEAPRWGLALALLGIVLVGAAIVTAPAPTRARSGPHPLRRPRPIGAGVVVAVSVLAAALGANLIESPSDPDRATLRDAIDEEPSPTELVSPLDVTATALTGPDAVLGEVTVDPPGQARLPVATFDDYDGDTFRFGTDLVPVGERVDAPAGPGPDAVQDLDLDSWPFAALPHGGPAQTVEAPGTPRDDVGVDTSTGRLVTSDGRGRWRITSRPDGLGVAGGTAVVSDADLPPLPELPKEFDAIVVEAAPDLAARGPTVTFVEELADRFRSTYRAVPAGTPPAEQRGGHGALVLGCVVKAGFSGAPDTCASRTGTRTQLAAAFVLVLREMGLSARLAVGFDLGVTSGPQSLTTHGLTAWAEVEVAGRNWVAVDPVPDTAGEAGEAGTGEAGGAPEDGGGQGAPAPDAGDVVDAVERDGRSRTVVLVGVGLVLLIGIGLAPVLVRRRRGRRRRSGTPATAAVGAWLEMRDRLRERGEAAPTSATVSEVVARHGADGEALAALINGAGFGGVPIAPDDAARCWEAVATGERAWRSRATIRQRFARYLRCGPVIGRRTR
ncbi:MAG: transglutaminase-like domain-containing protein [Iamia sp.]